jgi:gliding motility-associated-like protein
VSYKWFPNINLSSDTVKNPIATADKEIDYTVTITDVRGCKSTDVVHFEVLEPLKIPNVFTPNGDGINDLWTINELIKYPDVKVSVFTRNGAQVYSSDGYSQPWDGTFNGTILPVGTYYYIVTSILDELSFAGYVAILK